MTSRQTPVELKESYGYGFAVGTHTVGHGGAYSTDSKIDKEHGLILIWLVQHAGFPGEGAKAQEAFRQAAIANFQR
jgi:CubicO group peptidase (beta-lactamase class C family)